MAARFTKAYIESLRFEDFEHVARGKTKHILRCEKDPDIAKVESSDRITGGDGKRADVLQGKGALSNETTCNVFELLKKKEVPCAFIAKASTTAFYAEYTTMLPFEVVVRRVVGEKSSFRKRNPKLGDGYRFPKPVVEFFLKTSGRMWNSIQLPCDDPLLVQVLGENAFDVYQPSIPLDKQMAVLRIPYATLGVSVQQINAMRATALIAFTYIEDAWKKLGGRLDDCKFEFGLNTAGELRLSDVVDNDSWRLFYGSSYICKQPYRDGAPLPIVFNNYEVVAGLSKKLA